MTAVGHGKPDMLGEQTIPYEKNAVVGKWFFYLKATLLVQKAYQPRLYIQIYLQGKAVFARSSKLGPQNELLHL